MVGGGGGGGSQLATDCVHFDLVGVGVGVGVREPGWLRELSLLCHVMRDQARSHGQVKYV